MSEPHPSATVVLLREGSRGALEFLLLQRAPREDGKPGAWVFPGGKVEASDRASAADEADAIRRAALRETHEEAGLRLPAQTLQPISRWITPDIAPRRFDTWFFLGLAPEGAAVRVDGGEIVEHRWLEPKPALEAHHGGVVRLAPPTFVTVEWLSEFVRVGDALRELPRRELITFRPRICRTAEGDTCILYPGDAGYGEDDPDRPGSRHRLWMSRAGYRYERGSER